MLPQAVAEDHQALTTGDVVAGEAAPEDGLDAEGREVAGSHLDPRDALAGMSDTENTVTEHRREAMRSR